MTTAAKPRFVLGGLVAIAMAMGAAPESWAQGRANRTIRQAAVTKPKPAEPNGKPTPPRRAIGFGAGKTGEMISQPQGSANGRRRSIGFRPQEVAEASTNQDGGRRQIGFEATDIIQPDAGKAARRFYAAMGYQRVAGFKHTVVPISPRGGAQAFSKMFGQRRLIGFHTRFAPVPATTTAVDLLLPPGVKTTAQRKLEALLASPTGRVVVKGFRRDADEAPANEQPTQ